MRRRIPWTLAGTVFAVLLTLGSASGTTFPAKAPGMVTDAANVIPPNKEAEIERKVRDYEQKTSIEIAVVTVRSLEGLAPEDYAQELGTAWGVGKRGVDNGVLLLLAVTERKIRIHTGYGIEPDLTDASAGRVIKEQMAPLLKKGQEDWGAGVLAGVQGVIDGLGEKPFGARLEERKKPAPVQATESDTSGAIAFFFLTGVILLLAIVGVISSARSRRSSPTQSSSSRKSRRDDDNDFASSIIIGSVLASTEGGHDSGRSDGGWSGGFKGSDSGGGGFDFGGGGFGGGGASGDF